MLQILSEKALNIILGQLTNKFSSMVIERLSRYRANQFFKSFIVKIAKTKSVSDSGDMLLKILDDEHKAEILFEAYRKVVMSASKILGPRIIGFLTADLVAEGRIATDTEERMAMAAEYLNDLELTAFSEYLSSLDQEKDIKKNNNGDLEIYLHSEQKDSNFPGDNSLNIGPMPLGEVLGVWAIKLKNLGILRDEIMECSWKYEKDGERYIDESGSVTEITWSLLISEEYQIFAALIQEAINLENTKSD